MVKITPRIITLCGIDGSGKTTQIRLLTRYLKIKGVKVKYVWFRWPILTSYPFLAVCRMLGYTKWLTTNSKVKFSEKRFYLNKALALLWPWFFVSDALLHSFIRIIIPLKRGRVVICDRYVPDIFVDLMCNTRDSQLLKRLPSRMLVASIPKSTRFLLIDIAEETAFKRKNDIPNMEYLHQRRTLYLKLAEIMGFPVLNGEKKPSDTHQEIKRRLQL